MNNEQFKDVCGYEGLYRIGDNGTVLSLRFGKVKNMGITERGCNNAYSSVALLDSSGVRKKWYVHRLVALAFVEGNSCLQVNHKDMNKLNNNFRNLEWVTCVENVAHAFKNKPELFMSNKSLQKSVPVTAICSDGKELNFRSISEACEKLGIKSSTRLKICIRLGKKIKGYLVRFSNPVNVVGFGCEMLFPCG